MRWQLWSEGEALIYPPEIILVKAFSTRNRTPTRALGGSTPYEAPYGVKPGVAHLHEFGALCAVVEPNLQYSDVRAQPNAYEGIRRQYAV